MRSPFLKGVLLGSLVAAVVMMTGTAFAGSGIGALFNLGKTNTVNRTTTLTGTTSGKLLQVTNKGTGAALGLTVKAGKPPLAVNSTAKVANLNADTVDGMHVFQSRRSVPALTADPVDLVTVPGFGVVRAVLRGGGELSDATFVNTKAPGNVTVGLCYTTPYLRSASVVAPDEGHTFNWYWEAAGTFDLFLADSTRAVSLQVWWWLSGTDTVEVFAQGIIQ